jgi:outer membrane efflux protein/MacB-like protein
MNFVALRMLTGDRAKYLGLIFAIAFCTFLLENQTSIFASILKRTGSQILDVTDADVWVMDGKTEYFEQTKALKDTDLTRVRGVSGVEWAVKLFKGYPVARTRAGKFASCILLGLDDATLTGAPRKMLLGSWERLREPDSIVIDNAGYILLFPGEPLELDRELEMNDHKVRIVGISDSSAPFLSNPVIHTRYSEAVNFVGHERTQLSYVLVQSQPGVKAEEVCRRIEAQTGLRARTTDEFRWDSILYYLKNTGIPVNFGITITQLAAATARIGEAKADLFPHFVLTGTAGRQAAQLHDLTLGAANFFSVGPGISLPLFTGGRIRSNIAVQTSRQREAVIGYQSTVLNALEDVENALVSYSQEQERRDRLNDAVAQSQLAVDLATEQYKAGLVDFLSVLDAQRDLYANEDQLVQSQTSVTTNLVGLYRALGGGWNLGEP